MKGQDQMAFDSEDDKAYGFLCVLLTVPLLLTKGGTLYLLHKWFVWPISGYWLGFWQLIGLMILADLLISMCNWPSSNTPPKEIFNKGMERICIYSVSMLFGWIAHRMM